MFDSVLIANRGVVAVRVARACRELGVRSVGVYSEADRDALHVRACDEAHLLGPSSPAESYLAIDRLVATALAAGVDAVHPGYGFLAEDARFARAVEDAGLVFIGPSPEAIERMGDKLSARAVATAAGVPVVPGTLEPTSDPEVALAFAERFGYPVAVKAMFGGGGRGMKVVRDAASMQDALAAAQREATVSFGRSECYLERYLERPRHVEVQVLGDDDGTIVHLGERDCSLQRRHQKLIEEAPAPDLAPDVRQRITLAAIAVAREMRYRNAGTCEFLLDEDGRTFYFLEMNTRLQVEHAVTELVTGIDLVQAQLRVAAGEGLGFTQRDVRITGHAMQARINAEDPGNGFLPCPGPITRFLPPSGPWVRVDSSVAERGTVAREYDSMIAKVVVWGADRDAARARLARALDELEVEGVPTTARFQRMAVDHPQFVTATHCTASVEHEWDLSGIPPQPIAAAAPAPGTVAEDVTVEVDGRRFEVRLLRPAPAGARPAPSVARPAAAALTSDTELVTPMQGTVITYAVEVDEVVVRGDLVAVIEAMKMENAIVAHRDGVVTSIGYRPGDVVEVGAVLATIEDE